MNFFYTGDNHWHHFNVIKYSNRPFNSLEEMNEVMIERWNKKVGNNDTVYNLGDMFLTTKIEEIEAILTRLKGRIRLLTGNHDKWVSKITHIKGAEKIILEPRLVETKMFVGRDKYDITMCHYPMLQWNKSHYGAIHLHGHSHGTLDEYNKGGNTIRFDVGVDSNNYEPISLEEIVRLERPKIEMYKGE